MNKYCSVVFLLAIILSGCQSKKTEIDQDEPKQTSQIDYEKEKEELLKLIDEESAAFWNKDFEKWANCWAHEDHIRTMGWWADGGVTVLRGWDERSKRMKEHMMSSPEPNPTATNVRREHMNLRIFENVAWMTFDQYGEDTGDALMDMPGLSRETRIFEKINGQWKIVYVGWLLQG